ncbi:MAG: OmpA family protein [Rhodobacteraceae bacterium]|nr:OmpA family protein [Paracoccaceae bacterium]
MNSANMPSFRITAIKLLVCASIAYKAASLDAANAEETPEYFSFEGKPTLEELERAFGLDAQSRAIYSVQGGFRFDAPTEGGVAAPTPAKPAPPAAAAPVVAAPAKPATPTKTTKPATVSVQQPPASSTSAPTSPPPQSPSAPQANTKPAPANKPSKPGASQSANIKSTPVPSVWVTEQIRFDNASDRLLSSEAGIVDRVGEMMIAHPYVRVVISGHANATGAATANDQISKRRAMAVRKYLWRAFAIPEERFELRWMGAREALPDQAPADPVNRRVQFGVMKP